MRSFLCAISVMLSTCACKMQSGDGSASKAIEAVDAAGNPTEIENREWITNLSFLSPDLEDFKKIGIKAESACFQLVRYFTNKTIHTKGELRVDFGVGVCPEAKLMNEIKHSFMVGETPINAYNILGANKAGQFIVGYLFADFDKKNYKIFNFCYSSSATYKPIAEVLRHKNCDLIVDQNKEIIDLRMSESPHIWARNIAQVSTLNKPKKLVASKPNTVELNFSTAYKYQYYYDHTWPTPNAWFSSDSFQAAIDACVTYANKNKVDIRYCRKYE